MAVTRAQLSWTSHGAAFDPGSGYNGGGMSSERKLARWQEAGLIDAETRARIEAFEEAHSKPILLYALGALGAGTVALGVVSIVAANWDAISGSVKLACDLLLGALIAAATWASVQRGKALVTEVLVIVFYGFTLASLALVGQIYQLDTPTYQALLFWSAVTLPLVLLGQSRYLAALVTVSLATTHGLSLEAFQDHIERSAQLSDAAERNLFASVMFASPLLYVPLARIPWLVRNRPEYSQTLSALAWAAVLCAGFSLQFVWYVSIDAGDTLDWSLAVTALLAGGLAAALPRLYPELPAPALRTLRAILGFGWLSLAAGTVVARGSADFVGAILQVAWLALFAWCGLQLGRIRLFNLLTAAIALRVLVIYFEVFGSLLSTGFGLISGGALTLLIAWYWRRKTRDLAQQLAASARSGGHVA
jgi:uncharacterized membrane protein